MQIHVMRNLRMGSWLLSTTTSESDNLISEGVSNNESDLGSVLKPSPCPLLITALELSSKPLKEVD